VKKKRENSSLPNQFQDKRLSNYESCDVSHTVMSRCQLTEH